MNNKVAILLPIYIGCKKNYLQESLNSLFLQTYQNFDIIMAVDGPLKTEMEQYIISLRRNNIIILRSQKHIGLANNLNMGLTYCFSKGYEYIARIDSDDVACANRLEVQLKYLLTNKTVDVVGSYISEINETGEVKRELVKYPINHNDCLKFFKKRNPLAHPAVMFKKTFFEKAGYYTNFFSELNEDSVLWYHGFKHGCIFANVPEVLLKYRVTEQFYSKKRHGIKLAINQFRDRMKINKGLGFGYEGYFYAVIIAIIKIIPNYLEKISYNFFR